MFTSITFGFFGILGIFPLLCSTKWNCVRLELSNSTKYLEMIENFSVGIVCMVDPVSDNATSAHADHPIAIDRPIPASCHKHTTQKSRSVSNY